MATIWSLPKIDVRDLINVEETRPVALLTGERAWGAVSTSLTRPLVVQTEPHRVEATYLDSLAGDLPPQVQVVYGVGGGMVADAAKYFRATGGNEEAAGQRLADIVKDGIKNAGAQRTLREVVTADRAAVTGEMIGRASKSVNEFGIDLIDVRLQRIDLPDDVAARVYETMKQNFERQARQLRGEGEKDSQRIKAEADRKRTEILSSAARDALRIRGEGDATAAVTYAKAYERNPEFYAFYRMSLIHISDPTRPY